MNKKKAEYKTPKTANTKKKSPSVKELNDTIDKEKDKYVRLFAEFENYKRRTAKERIDLFKTAGKEVISSLIPVVEDFKRALNQEDANPNDTQGIQLIFNKLIETLKNQGLEELEIKVGDSFDSEIHEAISQVPAQNDDQKGKIIDIIEGGYKLGDQVLKFPKVVVAQ
ncbi:MAG: nucleotide exchange factor GrpE [Bacteroidetes bacterium]|nr:nucleotide exchange factor GrpE [Bacteroidota bacterium]MDA0885538.1 nucleotide exchange factor GrpE [Bacteroidota bacterium]MDA1225556.1 nucleotide exchange factor GrpE [Bacteroidota bacterium]